ncbi:unannotated protein [freshwater metagenome]|uniref:Unannotated protein n=1 Tax=freshwater metagenome TaxID=449393 RepID=A0A6J7P876_9ZZZZ
MIQLDDQFEQGQSRAIKGNRDSLIKRDGDLTRFSCSELRHLPNAGRWFSPRVLHLTALNRSAPQVVINGIELLFCGANGDVVQSGVFN